MARRPMTLGVLLASVAFTTGCAHQPLSPSDLDRFQHPAFISRIEEGAGPKATVFRDDPSAFKERLKTLEPQEGDRRLAAKLARGVVEKDKDGRESVVVHSMDRFEIADTLRTNALQRLPPGRPWSSMADPSEVARALESFLVDEVPANAPDYNRLKELGADAVLEIIVEQYGMRAEKGKAGITLTGTARLFLINGGTLYQRRFVSDELAWGVEGLDPFAVAKNPGLYRDRLKTMLVAIAAQVAADLTPPERHDVPAATPEAGQGDEPKKKYFKRQADSAADDPL